MRTISWHWKIRPGTNALKLDYIGVMQGGTGKVWKQNGYYVISSCDRYRLHELNSQIVYNNVIGKDRGNFVILSLL